MPATLLEQLGVWVQDFRERNWHTKLNESLTAINERLSRKYAGDPNGHVEGNWLGQLCWDTSTNKPWFCTLVGDAVTATWAAFDPDPIGTMKSFVTNSVPTGWLEMNGAQYTVGTYPLLEAVRPNWIVGGYLVIPNISGAMVTEEPDNAYIGQTEGTWTVTPVVEDTKPFNNVTGVSGAPAYDTPIISTEPWNLSTFNFYVHWAVRAR